MIPEGFEFPPLGATGEGDPPYPGSAGTPYWVCETDSRYGVEHQGDRPACALRCWFPGGGAPCDEETAKRFIAWVERWQRKPDVPPQQQRAWDVLRRSDSGWVSLLDLRAQLHDGGSFAWTGNAAVTRAITGLRRAGLVTVRYAPGEEYALRARVRPETVT